MVGIAAVHVGGMTVHSFAGTGKGEDGIIELKNKVLSSQRLSRQWEKCRTLVIDEVSMVLHLFFDLTDSYRTIYLTNWMRLVNIFVKIPDHSVGSNSFFVEISTNSHPFLYVCHRIG